ncbi:MAG: hypothetical protein FP816_00745 [Desulfobacteraceae bacterium]|nr:hypothetical protein [Desulfobacteraceae bacterium]
MASEKRKKSNVRLFLLLALLAAALLFFVLQWMNRDGAVVTEIIKTPAISDETVVPIQQPEEVIDFQKLGSDSKANTTNEERKAELGVGKGIDIIAKPEESIKIGDTTVPMQDIIDKIRIKQGDIIVKSVDATNTEKDEDSSLRARAYGIYVVQPSDNIWNIHFRFLQDYFKLKGVALSPSADEPDEKGKSSGVGKVLKFSENMVHIYNIKEKKLDVNIHLILPLSKIVVYNMDQVFSLLDEIDTTKVDRIQFDGEALWIQAD